MATSKTSFNIPMIGRVRIIKNGLMACASYQYRGNKELVYVYYADQNDKNAWVPPMTIAKTESGAIRKINQFFGSLEGATITYEH